MITTRTLVFASVVAAAMIFGGVLGATAMSRSTLTAGSAASAATSPTPGFKSNEDPTHEKGESAAQETAENNGTFHPAGPGGAFSGHSNEAAGHEAGESAAREAQENAAAASPSPAK
jgi:hypothetical protein